MRGGDFAVNVRTGECRLVIEVDRFRDLVTFSGSMKWESTKDWITNLRVSSTLNGSKGRIR